MVAAYQARATIADAVDSALDQTVAPYEVIVVDDGSTDGTGDVLAAYGDRIVNISQTHQGASAARNAGFERAKGDFVSILDADDVYEPRRLEALSELGAARPDLDILMTDAYLEIGNQVVGRFSERTPFATSEQNIAIFDRCFIAWPAVRRGPLLAIGGFDQSLAIAHDWDCWIRLLHAGSSAGLVDEPLMRYRMSASSLTASRVASLRERVSILELAAHLDLSADERRAVARVLPARRRRALLAEAEQALRERRPDARRRAVDVALASGMRPVVRLAALAAAVAPRAAARRLDEREAKTGSSRIVRLSRLTPEE